MDLEREMESVQREARARLEADRQASAEVELARHTARAREPAVIDAAESLEPETSGVGPGTKALAAIGALVVAWFVVTNFVFPFVKLGVILAVLVGIAWFVWKLLGGGSGPKKG